MTNPTNSATFDRGVSVKPPVEISKPTVAKKMTKKQRKNVIIYRSLLSSLFIRRSAAGHERAWPYKKIVNNTPRMTIHDQTLTADTVPII